MTDKEEFEKRVATVLAESGNIDYPANLHGKIMEELEKEMPTNSSGPISLFSYGFAFACVFILIAYSAFYFLTINKTELDNNSNKPQVIVTNMKQGELEEVTEDEIKQFFAQLKKYNEQHKLLNPAVPENVIPEAHLASDR
ncbi:MAG: hypothetical protein PHF29_04340 [Candidatus Riflebacteria bacterium]|nr:hypothetical protein [Candidatus Riflebacteria bacterium]